MESLKALYGENAFNLALQEIKKLQENSNIPFDNEYVQLGFSFLMMNAEEIIKENKNIPSLYSLVSESFGAQQFINTMFAVEH